MPYEEANFCDSICELPKRAVCSCCGQEAQNLFYLDDQPYCTACCDELNVAQILHFIGAQSVSDLLCDFGFCPTQN